MRLASLAEGAFGQTGCLIEAARLCSQARYADALEWLADAPVDNQHWASGYLRSLAAGLTMHPVSRGDKLRGRILAVDFSPDGTLVAAGATAGNVHLLEAETGRHLHTLYAHRKWVRRVVFHPKGNILASGGDDGKVRLWQTQVGLEILSVPQQLTPIRGLAFSPDGDTFASGSLGGKIALWSTHDGKLISTLAELEHGVGALAYSPDGKVLAAMTLRGQILLIDIATGKLLSMLGKGQASDEVSIAFSPDGALLACGHQEEAVVYEVATGKEILTVDNPSEGTCQVAFIPFRQWLLIGRDHTLSLWDPAGREMVSSMTGRCGDIQSVAVRADGSRIAVGSPGAVDILAAPVGSPYRMLGRMESQGRRLSFAGDRLLAGNMSGIWAWDLDADRERSFPHPAGRVLAISANGERAAGVNVDRQLLVWNVRSGEVLYKTDPLKKPPATGTFTHDGSTLLVGEWDESIRAYNVDKQYRAWSSGSLGAVPLSLALDPRGGLLYAALRNHSVAVLDMNNRQVVQRFPLRATAVACSPQGALAVAGSDRAIRIVSAADGAILKILRGHQALVSQMAFTADGNKLASASADGTVRVWDPSAGVELVSLGRESTWFTSVAFSDDERHLVATDRNGGVHLWENDRVWSERTQTWLATEQLASSSAPRDQPTGPPQKSPAEKPAMETGR
ncbi:MAG: WD40 repeat domain-containing protein [Phycisphaerales bacterium]|nr:MAG: WD40 repeat domain-containing protein [Phycisphaerales bacterium]